MENNKLRTSIADMDLSFLSKEELEYLENVDFGTNTLKGELSEAKGKINPAVKYPECLKTVHQHELDMFGGLCEECSGAFND